MPNIVAQGKQVGRRMAGAGLNRLDRNRKDQDILRDVIAAHIRESRELVVASNMVPDQYRIYALSELAQEAYLQHITREKDYKGIYYTVFGTSGYKISGTLELDIIQLILASLVPPLGINLSLGVSVTVEGGKIPYLLLMLHRSFPHQQFSIPANPGQSAWKTQKPINFLALHGNEISIKIKGEIGAGISIGLPTLNIDGHSLELNLASVAAGVEAGCKFYHLTDPFPGYYPLVSDPKLETDFGTVVSPGKEELKRQINAWRVHIRDNVLTQEQLDRPECEKLKELLNIRLRFGFSRTQILRIASTEDVIEWIDQIDKELNDLIVGRWIIPIEDQERNQLENYLKEAKESLQRTKWHADNSHAKGSPIPLKTDYAESTEANLASKRLMGKYNVVTASVWGLGGSVSASAGLSIVQEFPIGEFFPALAESEILPGIDAGLNLEAGVSITGNARFMSSRYQTISDDSNGGPMIFTQDTKVTYSQVVLSSSGVATAAFKSDFEISFEREREKLLKNDMNYYSACAYWLGNPNPFVSIPSQNSAGEVPMREGSGLSLGISISLKKLHDYKEILDLDPEDDTFFRKYPQFLGIEPAVFKQFILSLPDLLFEDPFITEHPYILLESSFRFKTLQNIRITENGHPESLTKKFFRKQDGVYSRRNEEHTVLESIRVRVRYGSDLDQTRSVFKLGVQVAGIGANAGIEHIKRAGNMFIEDLYIWDVPIVVHAPPAIASSQPITSPAQRKKAQSAQTEEATTAPIMSPQNRDHKVPATVLLPHTFEIN